jgi:hypothetical protein
MPTPDVDVTTLSAIVWESICGVSAALACVCHARLLRLAVTTQSDVTRVGACVVACGVYAALWNYHFLWMWAFAIMSSFATEGVAPAARRRIHLVHSWCFLVPFVTCLLDAFLLFGSTSAAINMFMCVLASNHFSATYDEDDLATPMATFLRFAGPYRVLFAQGHPYGPAHVGPPPVPPPPRGREAA